MYLWRVPHPIFFVTYGSMEFTYVRMYVCMYVCMYVYMYVCMYVCMYVYVCMHVCMYVYACVNISLLSKIKGILKHQNINAIT
jgi:hypothetical protein